MSRQRIAHRAEFSVRCACGMVYNTDDSHIGKQLKCRCGRTVAIARPTGEYAEAHDAKLKADDAIRAQERQRAERKAASQRAAARRAAWLAALKTGPRVWLRAFSTALVESLMAMNSRRPIRRWTARGAWAWSALMLVTWLLLIFTSEHFLPATILAYGPRFLLLLPFAILLPMAAVVVRSALVPLVLALYIVLSPIMGGRVSWRTIGRGIPAASPSERLRVLSFNTEVGGGVAMQLREMVSRLSPDLIAMQECGPILWDSLRVLPGWHAERYANLCTASRFPITAVDSMPRRDFERIRQFGFGGTGLVVRYTLETPHGVMGFVNLHLETARKGLEALTSDEGLIPDKLGAARPADDAAGSSVDDRLSINAEIRERESERASVWAVHGDQRVPVLIAGDFNLPVESAIYRRHWSRFDDAFETSGTGFGWSKREGTLLRVRIDHVLVNDAGPRPVGTWLGDDMGSDHLPVIADFAWAKR